MATCNECKVNKALKSPWERFRYRIFSLFKSELDDLQGECFTRGFGEGYAQGFKNAKELSKDQRTTVEAITSLASLLDSRSRATPHYEVGEIFQAEKAAAGKVTLRLDGEVLAEELVAQLKREAEVLQKTRLWFIIKGKLKSLGAGRAINSKDWEECLSGKNLVEASELLDKMIELVEKAT